MSNKTLVEFYEFDTNTIKIKHLDKENYPNICVVWSQDAVNLMKKEINTLLFDMSKKEIIHIFYNTILLHNFSEIMYSIDYLRHHEEIDYDNMRDLIKSMCLKKNISNDNKIMCSCHKTRKNKQTSNSEYEYERNTFVDIHTTKNCKNQCGDVKHIIEQSIYNKYSNVNICVYNNKTLINFARNKDMRIMDIIVSKLNADEKVVLTEIIKYANIFNKIDIIDESNIIIYEGQLLIQHNIGATWNKKCLYHLSFDSITNKEKMTNIESINKYIIDDSLLIAFNPDPIVYNYTIKTFQNTINCKNIKMSSHDCLINDIDYVKKIDNDKIMIGKSILSLVDELVPENKQCVICCKKSERKVALIPCGHTQYCETCIHKIDKCSLCRETKQGTLKIF